MFVLALECTNDVELAGTAGAGVVDVAAFGWPADWSVTTLKRSPGALLVVVCAPLDDTAEDVGRDEALTVVPPTAACGRGN